MKKHLIKGLPDVIERVRQMREGVAGLSCEAAHTAEATSNQEYVKGLSAWNFDVKELRRQVLLPPQFPLTPHVPAFLLEYWVPAVQSMHHRRALHCGAVQGECR